MSFLAPLYLLGGLAVSLPVLLHLIRRTPRGRLLFSSLLFLSPSPPRITRRSRIEHWLLLALRASAIVLLAAAFARPFLRTSSNLLLDWSPGRQVALLIDTSASMQRGGLWTDAVRRAQRVLDGLGPNDLVALYQFDASLRLVVGFPESHTLDRQAHQRVVRDALRQLTPTWHGTNLGRAMTTVADSLAADRRDRGGDNPGQIVVISDCQRGADLAALQGYDWPADVLVTLETVRPATRGNATVRLLANTADVDLRARIANSTDAEAEEFRVGWVDPRGEMLAPTTIYVPAGQTRVVKIDERPAGADRLRLLGDDQDFDNDYFVAPFVQHEFSVVFLGDDAADDPRGLRYFLDRVWGETSRRKVTVTDVRTQDAWQLTPDKTPDLVVATGVGSRHRTGLQTCLESGGSALLLAASPAGTQAIVEFLPGLQLAESETDYGSSPDHTGGGKDSYALLSDVDFSHPLLAPFSDPRFGDFTKVRFWKHQRLQVEPTAEVRVLARFDDGSPALFELPVGRGRAYVLGSTWRPDDSQLALSSKFVPLMSRLLDLAAGVSGVSSPHITIGQPITLPEPEAKAPLVTTPDGTQRQLSANLRTFVETETPGTYRFQWPAAAHTFAVNLPAGESETEPIAGEQLEQLGVRLGTVPDYEKQLDRERQLRDIELESRQKLWQWLMVAAMGVLGVETFVAGRVQAGARAGTDGHPASDQEPLNPEN